MDEPARERFELQRQTFARALARLGDVLRRTEDDVVRDAMIQRFEFTYEMAWKSLFRYLVGQGENVAAKAWDVLPLAFESRLIAEADVWDRMRKLRNDTSHEYNEAKAIEASAFIRAQAHPAFQALADELARRATRL
jgi:nucleotidyltransferase substrate binding protein (TIGR01987 family)